MNPSDQAVYSELGALGEISSTLAVCIVLVVHSEAVRELIVVPTSEDDLQHDKFKKYIGRMSIVVLTRSGPAISDIVPVHQRPRVDLARLISYANTSYTVFGGS